MRVGLSGHGKMGQIVEDIINERRDMQLTGSVAIGFYASFDELLEGTEVIIDYSHPDRLDDLLSYATEKGIPLVIATTGYTDEQQAQIEEAAKQIPIVFSANYSLGINIMEKILRMVTPILKDSFDMEVIEKHHNQKLDAPSGTAKMLVRAMDPDNEFDHVEGRSGMAKRGREIGVHAIRGGTITGEHTAIFAGDDEILEIRHIANSRKIFALGSIKAAYFAVEAQPGLYTMDDVLFGEEA